MGTYYIWTIGCQMNRADSEKLASGLRKLGHSPTDKIETADIIVVNSCVVRQSAENRVVSRLLSLEPVKKQRGDMIVALTGCMVDEDASGLRRRFPWVDLFLRPGQFDELLEWAGPGLAVQPEGTAPSSRSPTAFVTIIEGCENYCSYCIVPYRRGKERSRTKADIQSEVLELARVGVREVTLLGQNVDSYGHDLPDRPDLADLLHDLSTVEGLVRIRFLTSHPKDMTGKLIETVAALDRVCEYISLPVQAGDDDILRAMGRGYSVERYRSLVERIRASIPGVAISTDVIVGFPGESEAQFGRTLQLLSDLRFDTVHVAAYSPRPGTTASKEFRDDVPPAEKKRRLRTVEELQTEISSEINARLRGREVDILIERQSKGKWEGRTRTGKIVFIPGEADLFGRVVRVEIVDTSPWSLQGRATGPVS